MTKQIKTSGAKGRRILSTSKSAALVDLQQVATALGAERVMTMPKTMSPPALLELRHQLYPLLKSRGGRPGLEGADLRPKIPMSLDDWNHLEGVAQQLADDGFAPTAGQVGAQLLHTALTRLRSESQPGSLAYPLPGRASEPTALYAPSPTSPPTTAQQAARRHLQQAQDAGDSTSRVRNRRITKFAIENLERLFAPPGLPMIDKGGPSPTTSIAILGDAGAGKTTFAVSLAHAIAADAHGIALYLTTEVAPTEIKYKMSMIGMKASVITWNRRASAQAGDIVGQHVSLLEGADDASSPIRQRALEAAWRLVDTTSNELPIGCVVIDAFPLPEPSDHAARSDVVSLIQALEGRGVSVVIVEEVGTTDFVPFVTDVVFQLTFDEDADTGERARKLDCPKSRYARLLAGPHDTGFDRDRLMVWPAPLLAAGGRRIGAARR